jgi:plasmid replication initiation protein
MDRKVEGGIKQNQDLVRFEVMSIGAPVKDQLDLMSRNWFSLVPGRTDPIKHSYMCPKSNREETIEITCSQPHGIATIHDQDLIIFVISQWIAARKAGTEYSRRVSFTPYQYFKWIGRAPTGKAYQRLKESLKRLSGTQIHTTKNFDKGTTRRRVAGQFTWVSESAVIEENGNICGIEVVLAEWLYESVQGLQVLTLDPRYFGIRGGIERWLYLYARKAAGNREGLWKEGFQSLYRKSASQQAYKVFKFDLLKLIRKNDLPGIKLEHVRSRMGDDMLLMEYRRDQALPVQQAPAQMELIEKTPLEQDWENLLEVMKRRIGEPTVNSWFGKVEFRSFEAQVLTLAAPTKFIADRTIEQFKQRLESVWESFGHEVDDIVVTAPPRVINAG